MRPPSRREHEFDFLAHDERAELHSEFHEVGISENAGPMASAVGVVVELPHVNELIDRADVADEVPNQLLRVAALVERRIADLGIELGRLPT